MENYPSYSYLLYQVSFYFNPNIVFYFSRKDASEASEERKVFFGE